MSETSPWASPLSMTNSNIPILTKNSAELAVTLEKRHSGRGFSLCWLKEGKQLAIDRYVQRQRGESVPDR
ncbi:MAG: hypothetical protein R2860_04495 [Desulfobacterales bacterium]